MEEKLKIKLPVFEGPLDLLLHLIDKNKVNIYDIPIALITDQYMAYLDEMKKADLNIMSEFLVMASTLLAVKAKMLLPRKQVSDTEGEEELDPRAELVQQLLEYKMYKCFAEKLRENQNMAEEIFYKEPTIPDAVAAYEVPVHPEELVKDITLEKLNLIFQDVLKRQKNRLDPIRSRFGSIKKEEVSLEEKTRHLLHFAAEHRRFSFRSILESAKTKTEVIVTFLAVLELMKAGQISAKQEETFGEIEIVSRVAA
ncbi:MAG: segregation/condensation protein A [Lachnospiraceae bacterium]|nr:segregation/condensation protein A [Lachnospiraceae bacterium]